MESLVQYIFINVGKQGKGSVSECVWERGESRRSLYTELCNWISQDMRQQMACKGCSIIWLLPHKPDWIGEVYVKSLGSSAGQEVEFEVDRGYKSQRTSLSSTEQPLSLTYTLANTWGKSLIQTQVTRQTRSQDWDRQTTKGCFSTST